MKLSAEQTGQFRDDGYLLLHDILPVEEFIALIQELEQVIDAKATELHAAGRLGDLHRDKPFENRLHYLCEDADDADEMYRVVFGKRHKTAGLFKVWTLPVLLDLVEPLIGSEILAHPQFNTRAKLAFLESSIGPFHQDGALLAKEAEQTAMVNCWIPLLDVTMEMGGMQVVPGSHKWGVIPHEDNGRIMEEDLRASDIVDCPVPLGGVLLFDKLTAHRALPNRTDKARWSLDLRYCDANAPTGRDYPGFLVRSLDHPERVATDHYRDWTRLYESENVPEYHRITDKDQRPGLRA
jgi:hypothetical protein